VHLRRRSAEDECHLVVHGVCGLKLVERYPVLAPVGIVDTDAVAVDTGHDHGVLFRPRVGNGLSVVRLVVAAWVGLPVERHPDHRGMPRLDRAVNSVRRDALAGLGNRCAEVHGGSPHGRPVDAIARLRDLASVGIAHEVHIGVAAVRLAGPVMDQVDADLIEDLLLGGGLGVVGQARGERGLLAGQVVLLVIPRHVDGDGGRSGGRRRGGGGRRCRGMGRRGSRSRRRRGRPWRGGCGRTRRGRGRWRRGGGGGGGGGWGGRRGGRVTREGGGGGGGHVGGGGGGGGVRGQRRGPAAAQR